jgi:hypothetical protein
LPLLNPAGLGRGCSRRCCWSSGRWSGRSSGWRWNRRSGRGAATGPDQKNVTIEHRDSTTTGSTGARRLPRKRPTRRATPQPSRKQTAKLGSIRLGRPRPANRRRLWTTQHSTHRCEPSSCIGQARSKGVGGLGGMFDVGVGAGHLGSPSLRRAVIKTRSTCPVHRPRSGEFHRLKTG